MNDPRPRVSICIPTYNASSHIERTIQSVLDSSFRDLEIIVNDDVSTDDTRETVERFDDERVHFFQNEERVGVPSNWNRALQKASGEFVGLLNHDDLYGPFWLTRVVYVLDKFPRIGWVASAFRVVDKEGETLAVKTYFPETREYSQEEVFLFVAQWRGLGPGFITRREILEEVNYYDNDAGPGADIDLCLRLATRYPLYYSTYPHTVWRLHSGNLTQEWGPIVQAADCLRILDKVFADSSLPEDLRRHEESCYCSAHYRVLAAATRLLEKGDLKTVQQLLHLLLTCR